MRNIVDASKLDLKSTIVQIRRVAKTVKGGRNMRFSVTVVVGDGNGYVGVGLGKSIEIPEAVTRWQTLATAPRVAALSTNSTVWCIFLSPKALTTFFWLGVAPIVDLVKVILIIFSAIFVSSY